MYWHDGRKSGQIQNGSDGTIKIWIDNYDVDGNKIGTDFVKFDNQEDANEYIEKNKRRLQS